MRCQYRCVDKEGTAEGEEVKIFELKEQWQCSNNALAAFFLFSVYGVLFNEVGMSY